MVISDRVKAAPEILPATTIGMFPKFFSSQTVLHKGGRNFSLVLGVFRSPTLLLALVAGVSVRGKFDMRNISTSEMRAHQQQKPQ